jgi:muramoyltetrapeptide carboxypeptidase
VTALLAGIHARTGLAVVHGPSLMVQLAEADGVDPFTWASFERTLMRAEAAGRVDPSPEWTDEQLAWDEQDDRRRVRVPNAGPRVVRAGDAEGALVAGNLVTLLALAGTAWWPELDGAILCLEDDDAEGAPQLDRMLTQLRQLGGWERVAGLALGRWTSGSRIDAATADAIVLEATRGSSFPIVADLDFGHTDPMICLPWGVRARLADAALELLEPAVADRR